MSPKIIILWALVAISAIHCIEMPMAQIKYNRTNVHRRRTDLQYGIRIEEFSCHPNPVFISNISCILRHVAQERILLEFRAILTKPCNELRVHVKSYYLYEKGSHLLLNRWEDICGYLSGEVPSFLMDMVIDNIRKYSNLNGTCPFSGELRFKADRFPAVSVPTINIMPTGRIRSNLTFTNGPLRTTVGSIIVSVTNLPLV